MQKLFAMIIFLVVGAGLTGCGDDKTQTDPACFGSDDPNCGEVVADTGGGPNNPNPDDTGVNDDDDTGVGDDDDTGTTTPTTPVEDCTNGVDDDDDGYVDCDDSDCVDKLISSVRIDTLDSATQDSSAVTLLMWVDHGSTVYDTKTIEANDSRTLTAKFCSSTADDEQDDVHMGFEFAVCYQQAAPFRVTPTMTHVAFNSAVTYSPSDPGPEVDLDFYPASEIASAIDNAAADVDITEHRSSWADCSTPPADESSAEFYEWSTACLIDGAQRDFTPSNNQVVAACDVFCVPGTDPDYCKN